MSNVSPFWENEIAKNPLDVFVVPGGDPENVPQGGARVSPCTLGDANSYDRPPGNDPYASAILGDFNLDRLFTADDFTPTQNGRVNSVEIRGYFNSDACTSDANPSPHNWTVAFYNYDTVTGLPGTLIATFRTEDGTMTAAQGTTGLPVGIFINLDELCIKFNLSQSHTAVNVVAGTCYFAEFYFTTPLNCFFTLGYSYESTLDNEASQLTEGNRSSLRRNNRIDPAYDNTHFLNLDVMMGIGFTNAAVQLAPSNDIGSCVDRPPPANDNISGAEPLACNAQEPPFDNTYAIHQRSLDPVPCRKSSLEPDRTSGDVWFRLNPNPNTSAKIQLCNTDLEGGLSGGDSFLQVYRLTVPANGVNINNLTQIGCSDDACVAGFSEVNLTSLNTLPNGGQNQNLYIRVSSFDAVDQGIYTINVDCPIPIPANDTCVGAIDVPADPAGTGFASELGALRAGQTRTANIEGNVTGCPDAGVFYDSAANASRSVWYRLTGRGNRVLISTDNQIAGTAFDTELAVYCGSCDASGAGISCIAAQDDKSLTIAQSELQFCARQGVTYYIQVDGFGTATGDFALLLREVRATNNQPIPCCENQPCGEPCDFEIPAGANVERGENTNGPGTTVTEPCLVVAPPANSGLFNNGCNLNPPAGEDRRYGTINLDEVITGTVWSQTQARDFDWHLFEALPGARSIVQWEFQGEGPFQLNFFNFAGLFDFSDCTPAFRLTIHANAIAFCGQTFTRVHYFESAGTGQTGTAPGNTVGLQTFSTASGGEGYPCGTKSRYWLRLRQATDFALCPAVPFRSGTAFESTQLGATALPTFDGTGGDDGFTEGEDCIDNDIVNNARKGGCFATTITNGEFLRMPANQWVAGKIDQTVSDAGGSVDFDYYKIQIDGSDVVARLKIESGGAFAAQITNEDCTQDGITLATAATRGNCVEDTATADDIVVLTGGGNRYIVVVFATDAFGGGQIFGQVRCAASDDGLSRYNVILETTPVPDCSANPIPAPTETETCVLSSREATNECLASENDGCLGDPFTTGAIADNVPQSGTLFTIYDPAPLYDVFTIDQDYWTFTINAPARLNYRGRADGPVRLQVAETGVAGANCYDDEFPLNVLGAVDAGNCTNGSDGVLYLNAGTYSIIVSPGSRENGLSTSSYDCNNQLAYQISINLTPLGSCCVGTDCVTATQADCTTLGGSGWVAGTLCGDTYSNTAFANHAFTSIANTPNATQLTGFEDDSVVATNMGANFKLFGRSYTPAQIAVASNGYVVFGADLTDPLTGAGAPEAFPYKGNPNAIVAPFFHDWNPQAPGAEIWIRNSPDVQVSETIIEWRNMARQEDFAGRANFQVVLKRPSNSIEFRYGSFSTLMNLADISTLDGDQAEAFVGVEDETGLNGRNIAIDASFLTGNKSVSLALAGTPNCAPVCCQGNASKTTNGTPAADVDFADISAVLANFNQPANPNGTSVGDANCDGQVNFADVSNVLGNFLDNCD
ncbi:MAG: hypothetical protein SFZ24_08935 [Planctomycetota bacterium]|nr:hypothetical protein [Planctomycetota bacterium]